MTPTKPKIKPIIMVALLKFDFHFGLSKIINQMAVAAEMMETIALEMYCSDQIIAAISTNNKIKPISIA
jgi:hypothetical protein